MRKLFVLLWLLTRTVIMAWGQKTVLDSATYGRNWPKVEAPGISNNGKYAMYSITGHREESRLVITAIKGNWKIERSGSGGAYFTTDSRLAVIGLSGNRLEIVKLGTQHSTYLSHVGAFKFAKGDKLDWLAYLSDSQQPKLVVTNLGSHRSFEINSVVDFEFDMTANGLLATVRNDRDDSPQEELIWLNLNTGKPNIIWQGFAIEKLLLSKTGKRLIIREKKVKSDLVSYALWVYDTDSQKSRLLISDIDRQLPDEFKLTNTTLGISTDENAVYFQLKDQKQSRSIKSEKKDVIIWDYRNQYLPHEKSASDGKILLDCVMDLTSNRIIQLQQPTEQVRSFDRGDNRFNNYYVLVFAKRSCGSCLNQDGHYDIFVESISDGARKLVKKAYNLKSSQNHEPVLSPDEHFVIWFDPDSLSYYSYEIANGKVRNLSTIVPDKLYDQNAAELGRHNTYGQAGWMAGGRFLLLYAQYDIWRIDLKSIVNPVNLTQGIGQKNHIAFGRIPDDRDEFFHFGNKILLDGFNQDNKDNGFWLVDTSSNKSKQLSKCIMDARAYYIDRVARTGHLEYHSAGTPIKAKNVLVCLVWCMSAEESPNIFATTDFRNFRAISDVHPEKQYNWLTSELVTWQLPNGETSQGILYKPKDFDPEKKYPIIFNYYEQESDGLHAYIRPDFDDGNINIPSYVSNGYLVFIPDIHLQAGHPAKGILESVVSSAEYFSALPWIDRTKMGLQGHSFGGWVTNLLVTNCNLFAAACEVAGVTDQISAYGQTTYGGNLRQDVYEIYQPPYGLGVTPWTAPEAYMESSPVLFIDAIACPLLIVHSPKDGSVPFDQAVEMFTGMKRAGKKAWLLEYSNAGHTFFNEDAKDLTFRLKGFFDHYLKGAPAPAWMAKSSEE